MNNNMVTERAHLGVFSTSSFITVGDNYVKKSEPDPRLLGKQFSHFFPTQGIAGARPNNSLFEREHKWLYGGEKYIDRTKYIQTQPPADRKKGFYSSDASRRDEFTLDIETEKYRERIRTEMMFADRFAKRQEEELTDEERAKFAAIEAEGKAKRWTHGPDYLFDLGKEATGGTTPYEMKDSRDTWYSKHRVKSEDDGKPYTGGVMLSSHACGDNLKGFSDWSKPEFARQPIIRDSFFRSTGVLRPTEV
mmetsp:Transcript_44259/g.88437  ORF Transcript_44259/g.88437 Transcript_44259/m.88437 type:complete len:249 (-) Transcript_44259:503-1249(-)